MRCFLFVLLLVGLVHLAAADTFPVRLKIVDATGAAIDQELVIVQDLDNREHEIVRALSNRDGNIEPLQLSPGLYRVIATAPYGLWETQVREFLVRRPGSQVIVRVHPMPTHGNGDIVMTGTTKAFLRVIGPEGQPANGARILTRDQVATSGSERWYKADGRGTATIELVGNPTVVVVIYRDVLLTTELGQDDLSPVIRLQKPLTPNSQP